MVRAIRQLRVDNGSSKIEPWKVKVTLMLRVWNLVRFEEGCMIVSSTSDGSTTTPPSVSSIVPSFRKDDLSSPRK